MHQIVVNFNGKIIDTDPMKTPLVPVFDRGFLYGDSLYEVIRTHEGKLFQAKEHLDRLMNSAKLCLMTYSQTKEAYEKELNRTLAHFQSKMGNPKADAYLRIIVTRGVGPIGFGLKAIETPTQVTIIAQPLTKFTDQELNKGIRLHVCTDRFRNHPRALDPAMKSGNYLNCLLAFLEAQDLGYDDALLGTQDGFITEGTTFNIFYVKKGIVVTSPLEIGILEGTTRRSVLELAQHLGYETREVYFKKEHLYRADEVFATGTVKMIFPVSAVDKHIINKGAPGAITMQLLGQLNEWALQHAS